MLRLEEVHFAAGDYALSADLEVARDRRVAIVGPSGAGKSTLLDLIAGFRAPNAGRVLWDGRDITALTPDRRPVAMLFQDNNLFPHLTLERNLALALHPSGRIRDGRIDRALDQVGLAGMAQRKPGTLSGGQQSRAALARVLLQDRPLLLLDEPFAALGPALKREMLDLVATLVSERGMTALLVTHDPGDARRFAPQTIVVANGEALPPQETGALLDDPPDALADYLGGA